ncbi:hypothetical protein OG567_14030 [Streptomyces zaomyceticus]
MTSSASPEAYPFPTPVNFQPPDSRKNSPNTTAFASSGRAISHATTTCLSGAIAASDPEAAGPAITMRSTSGSTSCSARESDCLVCRTAPDGWTGWPSKTMSASPRTRPSAPSSSADMPSFPTPTRRVTDGTQVLSLV